MINLINKSKIIGGGTYWIEFNTAGTVDAFEHWHPSSKFAYPDDLMPLRGLFIECLGEFDFYSPHLISYQASGLISKRLKQLDNSVSGEKDGAEVNLIDYFGDCFENKKLLWILGL